MNYFELFKLKNQFDVDQSELKKRYIELQKQAHPDNNQNNFFISSAKVNQAYQTLKEPYKRALYCLKIHGIDYDLNQTCVDTQLLMLQMEIQESIEQASLNKDLSALEQLEQHVHQQLLECDKKAKYFFQNNQFDSLKEFLPNWQFLLKARKEVKQATLAIKIT